jgi:hypothetical protein
MLDARKNDDVETAASLFSAQGLKVMFGVEGDKQALKTAGALDSFEVTSVEKSGSGFLVHVKESWISGDDRTTYTVELVNGKPLIVNATIAGY